MASGRSLAGPLVYIVGSYTAIFVICSMLGTDNGMQVQYLAIAAGAIPVPFLYDPNPTFSAIRRTVEPVCEGNPLGRGLKLWLRAGYP
jgi:hypothetical protein